MSVRLKDARTYWTHRHLESEYGQDARNEIDAHYNLVRLVYTSSLLRLSGIRLEQKALSDIAKSNIQASIIGGFGVWERLEEERKQAQGSKK